MLEIVCALVVCTVTVGIARRCGIWTLPSFAAILFAVGYSVRLVLLEQSGQDVIFDAFTVQDSEFTEMAGYGMLAFFAMCTGMVIVSLAWKKYAASRPAAVQPGTYRPGGLLAAYLAGATVQAYLLSSSFGGLGAAITALSKRVFVGESFALAANLTPILFPLLLMGIIQAKRQGSQKLHALALAVFVISLPWMAIVNGRATVIVAIWALALAYFLAFRKKTKAFALLVVAGAALATSVLGLAWRASSQTGRPFVAEISRYMGNSIYISSESIPLFDHARVGMEYASVYGSSAETSVLNAFSVLIPRSIWADKPEFLPQILGERLKYTELSGLPAGLLGEGFITGGWLGAVAFALIFGLFIGLTNRYLIRSMVLTPLAAWGVFMAVNTALVGLRTGAQGGLTTLQISLVALPLVMAIGWATKVHEKKASVQRAPGSALARPRRVTS
ncbi:oligosaccharide repeat unit polymerase [Arthrobacter sp. FW305-BF8]|uniref:O-antigen polymerase n=1 Tax=Arthrobacter sp. FW305-BF8 TaxID=2879617 RepID=UPI001F44A107|nr:O-antigen polymerase [Arthrobacter sp. FW305-BF8]UKA53454.1 oligosaccharide repeat unit polymerase [Arthrobacter sp. FW305-BF8]